MRLFTDAGNQEPLLVDIWDRSSLDLTPEQMRAKFTTTKDLNEIWRLLRWTPPTSAANTSSSVSSKRDIKEKALRWSQLDTILIDDTPSKAALQPYNHLPISSMVQPSKMNGLSAVSSSPYMQANGAGSGQSEYKPDTCLVQIVAILEKLRYQSNVSNAIMLGQAKGLNEGEDGDEWAKAGFEVLKEKGIKVTRDFDGTWAQRVVKPALQGQ